MKFVTEMELRDLYEREPFVTFVLQPNMKITPGARQFLMDRRIKLVSSQCSDGEKSGNFNSYTQVIKNLSTLRLRRIFERVESLFLLTAAELLHSGDAVLSEKVMLMAKFFQRLLNVEEKPMTLEQTQLLGLREVEIEKQPEFMEISQSHLRLENGRVIAHLNHLRASLREMEPVILETYWDEEKQVCLRQDLIDGINLITNMLCMIMRTCLGGKNEHQ